MADLQELHEGVEQGALREGVRAENWGWNRRQRIALGILVLALLGVLAYRYFAWPARVDDPKVIVDGRTVTLPARVDPNTATREELARIPHLGEALAGKIVAYREERAGKAEGGIAFRELADLDHVPGVGKKVLEQAEPFLIFPGAADATGP